MHSKNKIHMENTLNDLIVGADSIKETKAKKAIVKKKTDKKPLVKTSKKILNKKPAKKIIAKKPETKKVLSKTNPRNSGRKSNESKGLEAKVVTSVNLYPSHKTKLLNKFGSLTTALESLV